MTIQRKPLDLKQFTENRINGNQPYEKAGYVPQFQALFDGSTGYLDRTFGIPHTQNVFSFSIWLKRNKLEANQVIFGIAAGSEVFYYTNSDFLRWYDAGTVFDTPGVYRDVNGWYHLLLTSDGTDVTAYVNGVQVDTAANNPTLINSATSHFIGKDNTATYLDAYYADIHFIDGQALLPTDFGEFTTNDGWMPNKYEGTYGTNGFYLDFSNSSNLGEDSSGNNNDWTVNGTVTQIVNPISVNDAIWNILDQHASNNNTFENEFTKIISGAGWTNGIRALAVIPYNTPIYWEYRVASTATASNQFVVGMANSEWTLVRGHNGAPYNDNVYTIYSGSSSTTGYLVNDTVDQATSTTIVADDIIQFFRDGDNFWIGINNVWHDGAGDAGANPSARTDPSMTISNSANLKLMPMASQIVQTGTFYFKREEWMYSPPTGGKELSKDNSYQVFDNDLTPHWNTVLYTGTGANANTVTGVGFQPDFVWIKDRDNISDHNLFDSNRGVSKLIRPNDVNIENTYTDTLVSFDSDGFTLNDDATQVNAVNALNDVYVAWCASLPNEKTSGWSGSPTVTPNKEIYNETLGMSIINYTPGVSPSIGDTIPCELANLLGKAPFMLIFKVVGASGGWYVYHEAVGPTKNLQLDTTATENTTINFMNDTAPTNQLITLGATSGWNNTASTEHQVIAFFETDFCKPIKYTGNGNADGSFVNLGISPEWSLHKRTNVAASWIIHDNVRNTINPHSAKLEANNTSVDVDIDIDYISNGIKQRVANADWNASGGTFIGIAIGTPTHKHQLTLGR